MQKQKEAAWELLNGQNVTLHTEATAISSFQVMTQTGSSFLAGMLETVGSDTAAQIGAKKYY